MFCSSKGPALQHANRFNVHGSLHRSNHFTIFCPYWSNNASKVTSKNKNVAVQLCDNDFSNIYVCVNAVMRDGKIMQILKIVGIIHKYFRGFTINNCEIPMDAAEALCITFNNVQMIFTGSLCTRFSIQLRSFLVFSYNQNKSIFFFFIALNINLIHARGQYCCPNNKHYSVIYFVFFILWNMFLPMNLIIACRL